MNLEHKKPEALLGKAHLQETRIQELIKTLNQLSANKGHELDFSSQRDFEDELIEIINDRFNGLNQDEYLEADIVEGYLMQIIYPSEYLRNAFYLVIYSLTAESAKKLSDEAALPISFNDLDDD